MRTVVVDSLAPGGAGGTSSRLENYLGFSTGICAVGAGSVKRNGSADGKGSVVTTTSIDISSATEPGTHLRSGAWSSVPNEPITVRHRIALNIMET